MDSQFPEDFDLIIVGTGMVESILSAAASRVGKRVLHIDRNSNYGGYWASYSLESIQILEESVEVDKPSKEELEKLLREKEILKEFGNNLFKLQNLKFNWHIPRKQSNEEVQKENKDNKEENNSACDIVSEEHIGLKKKHTQEEIVKDSRKFNIDLAPKLQYARGDFVELLISSNIARYSDYRSVSRVITWVNGCLETVPCSRADVFSNTKVSVVEKRMLMKLLTSLDEVEKDADACTNKTFVEFLKEKKLTPNLIHYVLYAISMSTDTTPCEIGIESTKRFLGSLGRFGKTPFLFSTYGSGEMPQAFCRLSAVFGGVFALNQPIKGFTIFNNKFKALLVGEQRIEADHLVMSVEKSPKEYVQSVNKKYISRCILITDKSVLPSENEHLTLLFYPPENRQNSTVVIELGGLTGTCPKDLYLVHLITVQESSPVEDFKHPLSNLFASETESVSDGKPNILWSCYFSLPDCNSSDLNENTPSNVFVCPGPDSDLDLDFSIKKAKEIFNQICPDMEFLPRAPDPEEICIEGEDEEAVEALQV